MSALRLVALALVLVAGAPFAAAAQRAPYLQSPTETSIVVAWRSASAQPSAVCYGTSAGALTQRAGLGAAATDHVVRITGLTPDTQYFYAAGQASCPPAAPGDARDTFRTAPRRGTERAFRMWLVGDSGTGGTRQRAVRDAMIEATADRRPDLFLHVGDMAYDTGTTRELDSRFFAIYADVLRNTPVWPAIGNHEGASSDSATQTGPYYEAYVLPTDGSAGGLASGTEAYYSFDWANVHFVVLDSHESPRSTTGAMLRWLDEDLAATDATWVIAYFHHPPYTDGTHDSDTERQHIEMRQNATPILEAHGVDAVLGGHSHIYERSYLLRGAYDTPTTAAGHIVDMGDGRTDGDGAYRSGSDGTLYVVAGHGGASTGGSGNHPVMFFSEPDHGSCIVDVDGSTLTLRNIRWDGVETDHVTLVKGEGVFLASPRGGERYLAGSTVRIAWSSIGVTGPITIEASLDGGTSWTVIADRTADDGVHDWVTPRRLGERVQVRVRASDAPGISDTSGDFALVDSARTTPIAFGDVWQYADRAEAPPASWQIGAGDGWPEGRAELGYGDGDEATVLRDETPNVPTVYFRQRITIANDVEAARVRAIYDDGIAVFVNGARVTSAAVDGGLDHATWASSGAAEERSLDVTLDLAASNPFVIGENWIAALVKQSSATSSDVSFDLELELGERITMIDPDPEDAGVRGSDGGSSDGGGGGGSDAGGGGRDGGGREDAGGAVRADASTSPSDAAIEPAPTTRTSGCGCRAGGRAPSAPSALGIALGVLVLARRRSRRAR